MEIDQESAKHDERHRDDWQIDERQRSEHAPCRYFFVRTADVDARTGLAGFWRGICLRRIARERDCRTRCECVRLIAPQQHFLVPHDSLLYSPIHSALS